VVFGTAIGEYGSVSSLIRHVPALGRRVAEYPSPALGREREGPIAPAMGG
jgi:hypothetical protein